MLKALIIAAWHENAKAAVKDAEAIHLQLLDNGWDSTLIANLGYGDLADLSAPHHLTWFSGEATQTDAGIMLHLGNNIVFPARELARESETTLYDCCHVGSLVTAGGEHPDIICASRTYNWNETDGSSVFSHAIRACTKRLGTPFMQQSPYIIPTCYMWIEDWIHAWNRTNSASPAQTPIMGNFR